VVGERVQSIDVERARPHSVTMVIRGGRYREGYLRMRGKRLGNSHARMMKATCPFILSWIPIAPPGFAVIVPNIDEDLGVIDIRKLVWQFHAKVVAIPFDVYVICVRPIRT
jgi:hypothetical protein